MPKVLISDKLSPRAADILSERGVEVDVKPGLAPKELVAIIGDYDGLAIRSATKVTADILAAAANLKVVGRAGIGVFQALRASEMEGPAAEDLVVQAVDREVGARQTARAEQQEERRWWY